MEVKLGNNPLVLNGRKKTSKFQNSTHKTKQFQTIVI